MPLCRHMLPYSLGLFFPADETQICGSVEPYTNIHTGETETDAKE
jgi:hypothetical protein